MLGLRLPELLLILLVVILLFGAGKLPQLGESLGKGIRAFRKASEQGLRDEDAGPAPAEKAQGELSGASAAARPEAEKKSDRTGGGAV